LFGWPKDNQGRMLVDQDLGVARSLDEVTVLQLAQPKRAEGKFPTFCEHVTACE
jgi:hypothetical protein